MIWNRVIIGIGVFLIVLGTYSLVYKQISCTRHKKVLDIGPIEATIDKKERCTSSSILFGSLVIASGLLIVLIESKRKP